MTAPSACPPISAAVLRPFNERVCGFGGMVRYCGGGARVRTVLALRGIMINRRAIQTVVVYPGRRVPSQFSPECPLGPAPA